jgi:predicted dehydrogenase
MIGLNRQYCIVGLGGHARNKIIPALRAIDQSVVGCVSNQSLSLSSEMRIFRCLDDALRELPQDTVFVIATPPLVHFEQAYKVAESGRDIFVEKPAFLAPEDVHLIMSMSKAREAFVVENFMYRHTAMYAAFFRYWSVHRKQIVSMNMVFTIPKLPSGTFRNQDSVASSSLFDIGCYGVSLLVDMQIPTDILRIVKVSGSYSEGEEVAIWGVYENIEINFVIGVGRSYSNAVELKTEEGEQIIFDPFFYGRPGERWITTKTSKSILKKRIQEVDAFETMFSVPRHDWLSSQVSRAACMVKVVKCLDMLGNELAAIRNRIKDL